jgi:hypothetical protein
VGAARLLLMARWLGDIRKYFIAHRAGDGEGCSRTAELKQMLLEPEMLEAGSMSICGY